MPTQRRGDAEVMVRVVGGGLAGSEAAWQLAERGHRVQLYEMRPVRGTPAHHTDRLAELVCRHARFDPDVVFAPEDAE